MPFTTVVLASLQITQASPSVESVTVQTMQLNSQNHQAAPVQPNPAPIVTIAPETPLLVTAPTPDTHANVANVALGRLDLTCLGAGTANKVASATIRGGGWAKIVGSRDRAFNDQVDVRLFADDDRIRMPRTMLPGIHGGQDGWFKLKNVQANERSIRASAAVNLVNNPKVFIDRMTGTISISGRAGDYTGVCAVIDTNAAPKF